MSKELIALLREPATPAIYGQDVMTMRYAADALEEAERRIADLSATVEAQRTLYENCTKLAAEFEEAVRKLGIARDALRLAGDEPNLDKARKIADTALAQTGEKQ